MGNVAIKVENLGKMYRIGGKQESYQTIRDTIVDAVAAPYRRVRGLLRGESASDLTEEIWALKDVSFEVKHGDVVGIIGRNGAGKSTLLKILSRITEPSTGYADVYGRIGALLEVGTGFHPELTGRENIFLNGAILGMSRAEMNRKFDEIVDFAGVERFIDTPVKHYSSGMGLRLGFAVAAHLEPEILIVDEVLAVGDAEFQKKCLGKMSDVASEGRTVLFVSHNMAAVQSLCSSAYHINQGRIVDSGDTEDVVYNYLNSSPKSMNDSNYGESKHFSLLKFSFIGLDGNTLTPLQPAEMNISVSPKKNLPSLGCYAGIKSSEDFLLMGLQTWKNTTLYDANPNQVVNFTFTFDELPLVAGEYYVTLFITSHTDINECVNPRLQVSVSPISHKDMLISSSRTWAGAIATRTRVKTSISSENR